MIKTYKFLIILIPAILIACLALFIRFIQYKSTSETILSEETEKNLIVIPIYSDDPVLGNKKASHTLIIFEDFGCEACKYQSEIFEELRNKYPQKIKVIVKGLSIINFPISTRNALEYSFCANKQKKFFEFSKQAFAMQNNLDENSLKKIMEKIGTNEEKNNKCLQSIEMKEYLSKNEILARTLNIQSLPAIFLDNKQITPPNDVAGWEAFLEL